MNDFFKTNFTDKAGNLRLIRFHVEILFITSGQSGKKTVSAR